MEKTCKNCKAMSPYTCVSGCKNWKFKNELRKLHEKTRGPNFMMNLLNTLKNNRRLRLLVMIAEEPHSIAHVNQKLRKLGFNHSQQTIGKEYLNPLVAVGLADEYQSLYHSTLFGRRISDLTKGFNDLEGILSPHSECYEEIALQALMKGPCTHEGLKEVIPEKSLARVLCRLQKAELAETNAEKDYVFFFATKRTPDELGFSPTEKKVYDGIPKEGISARSLARVVGISLRRTYKYVRKLKGKKLVFTRKRPISYSITAKGVKVGTMLEEVHRLAVEALTAAAHLVGDENLIEQEELNVKAAGKKKKYDQIVPLTHQNTPTKTISSCKTHLVTPAEGFSAVRILTHSKREKQEKLAPYHPSRQNGKGAA
jgi:predicted transcriptional regulator